MHEYAPLGRINQGTLNLRPVKAEDHDFDALFGFLNAFYKALNAVAGLNE